MTEMMLITVALLVVIDRLFRKIFMRISRKSDKEDPVKRILSGLKTAEYISGPWA